MMDILVLRNLVYVKKYCITDYYTFLTHVYGTHTHEHSVLSNTETVSRLKSKTKPMGFICY